MIIDATTDLFGILAGADRGIARANAQFRILAGAGNPMM
jgi:hypothetical protein